MLIQSGELIWKYDQFASVYSSPAIANSRVYVGSDNGYLYCLNANTGELIWKYGTNGEIRSSPAVAKNRVYVGSYDDYIYCLNADTGELIWKYRTRDSVYSSPAVAKNRLYVGSNDGFIYCFGSDKPLLSIDTTPSNASVYINNEYKGKTPLEIELTPGTYKIEIKKENYETYTQTIELTLKESKNISINLTRITFEPTTTPSTTTPTPTTTPSTTFVSTALPPQKPNSFLYLGIFMVIIVLTFTTYQITKKKFENKAGEKKLSKKEIEKLKKKLDEDYVEGKISKEEYLERKRELGG